VLVAQALLAPLVLVPNIAMLWFAAVVMTALGALQWPIVQHYLASGRHGAEMRHAIGWWNASWMAATAIGLAAAGPLQSAGLMQWAIPSLLPINLLALLFLARFPAHPVAHDVEEHARHVPASYRSLLGAARVLTGIDVQHALVGHHPGGIRLLVVVHEEQARCDLGHGDRDVLLLDLALAGRLRPGGRRQQDDECQGQRGKPSCECDHGVPPVVAVPASPSRRTGQDSVSLLPFCRRLRFRGQGTPRRGGAEWRRWRLCGTISPASATRCFKRAAQTGQQRCEACRASPNRRHACASSR
jgi:hypothetical protein